MKEEFTKYWEKMVPFASIAIVLNPRYKLDFHHFHCSAHLKLSNTSTEIQIGKIKDMLNQYYSSYIPHTAVINTNQQSPLTNSTQLLKEEDEDEGFKYFMASVVTRVQSTSLHQWPSSSCISKRKALRLQRRTI
ncbi:hypothetical protein MJO29_012711 [Puccinia striiformis f. sp. tritici]|nr:hypothetical protein MJO29_012711 [Puccinia striiformis f. sp. tritici]